jgi:hypothetical protein
MNIVLEIEECDRENERLTPGSDEEVRSDFIASRARDEWFSVAIRIDSDNHLLRAAVIRYFP